MELWGTPDRLTELLHLIQTAIPVCLVSCAGVVFFFVDPTQLCVRASCGEVMWCQ